ncbi:MAG: thiamine pyrophosphate-dependent enzyme, partial [Clostridiales bacterium]
TLHVEMPICADVKNLMEELNLQLGDTVLDTDKSWLKRCEQWKNNYPVTMAKHYQETENVNVYAFINEISRFLPENYITVVGNGSACVVGSHGYIIKKGQRFIINSAIASMGYDLPAAIGACIAKNKEELVCITGDGSIQMNLQELQTIITNHLPIKIFVINNEGYHSIRQTQKNFFGEPLVGIGKDSHDLDFPALEKLAKAYGYPYYKCEKTSDLQKTIHEVFLKKEAVICEIFVTKEQNFEPKSATKRLDDGSLVSAPLEDLAPFLSREELEKNMIIPLINE